MSKTRFLLLFLLMACRKEDTPLPVPTGPVTVKEINQWIRDSMYRFYYWPLPDIAPADRFSLLYDIFPRSLYTHDGIDITVIPGPGGAIGVIRIVIPGSAAERAGLQRGDFFTHINGITVTAGNAATLVAQMLDHDGSLTLSDGRIVSLSPALQSEEPVLSSTIWEQTAYLCYNSFRDAYNAQLLRLFRNFRNKGVKELILDLRYNAGGSVAAAGMLCALIAPQVRADDPFVIYTGKNGKRALSFREALATPETGQPVDFGSLQEGKFPGVRVFILCTAHTASAAELLINNLKPYTKVVLIGQTTYGKDEGAVIIRDQRSPKRINYTLLPIAYKLANARGEGGYSLGIAPDHVVDEMSQLPLLPFGDNRDPLTAKALAIIKGGGRQSLPESAPVKPFYESRQTALPPILPSK